MLNIGIDVDGVLTNLEKFQLENGKKYFGETSIVNEKAYDIFLDVVLRKEKNFGLNISGNIV